MWMGYALTVGMGYRGESMRSVVAFSWGDSGPVWMGAMWMG
jgi:hypothetical protein